MKEMLFQGGITSKIFLVTQPWWATKHMLVYENILPIFISQMLACLYYEILKFGCVLKLFPMFFTLFPMKLSISSKGSYIYDVHMQWRWGSLEICHMLVDPIVFKQKIYCSFLQMVGIARSRNWSIFVDVING